MTEMLRAFLKALEKDEVLKARLQARIAGSADDDVAPLVLDFARGEGYALTAADLEAAQVGLEHRQATSEAGSELDDAALSTVSGGFLFSTGAAVVGGVAGSKPPDNYFDIRKRQFWLGF